MQIIAHRGASGPAPENTLAAFRLAWRQAADGIELDIRLSGDGQVIVHHDADTRRTGAAATVFTVADTDYATLAELDVGRWRGPEFAGEKIPLLAEVLAAVPAGQRVLIESKCGPDIIAPLARVLTDSGARRGDLRPALISFHLDTLIAARAALPDLPCYPVFSRQDGPPHAIEYWIELARRYGFAGLDPSYRDLDAASVTAVKNAGLELITWTVNDPHDASRLRRLGVDAITSDWPTIRRHLS